MIVSLNLLQSMNRASARKVIPCIQKGFRTLSFAHFVMLPTYTKINHLKNDPEKWDAPELNFKCHSKGFEYIQYVNVIFQLVSFLS